MEHARGRGLILKAVSEQVLHRYAVRWVKDVVKLDVEVVEIELIVGRNIDRSSGRSWDKREQRGADGANCPVIGCTENLIAARPGTAVEALALQDRIGEVAVVRSSRVHSGFDALRRIEDFRGSRRIYLGWKLIFEVESLI